MMDAAGTADPEGDWQIRAPELFQGVRASVASDIYSSGVTLYALIAGRLPFDGINLMSDLEAAVSAGRYEPIRDAAPHVSQELADRIRKAMSLDPAQRFATASEFDNALSLRTRARRFTPIAPHKSHGRCWLTDGGGGSLNVCVRDASWTGGMAVEVRHVSSGNRVKELCGEAKARDLPKRLRKLFNALR
jgi:eukaryotic-like serine/threonine-protein kinase